MMKVDNQSIASAGQYFVCAELSRRGAIASLTMGNTQGIDVLAASKDGKKSAFIQVKTTRQSKWILGVRDTQPSSDNMFYIFVRYRGIELPEYYIVPAKVVAETLVRRHEAFLRTPGRRGQAHKDSTIRIWHEEPEHKDNWKILGVF